MKKLRKQLKPQFIPGNGRLDKLSDIALRYELAVILILCALGMLRIFIYCAAYPFFNNVDEQAHLDLVQRYSHAFPPHDIEFYDKESSRLITTYETWEYFNDDGIARELELLTPPWKQNKPLDQIKGVIGARILYNGGIMNGERVPPKKNHEAMQPPAYYTIAGDWYLLGKAIGLRELKLLFWIRFLNIPIYGLLIWLSYVFMKRIYPDRNFLHFGVPALLAFFPQDLFYSISSDVPMALLFGAAFYSLILIYEGKRTGIAFHALTGILVALTFLTKLTTVPIILIALVLATLKIRQARRSGELRAEMPRQAALVGASVLPVLAWFAYNLHYSGTITLSSQFAKYASLTPKPFFSMFDHPIFTPAGLWTFLQSTLTSFWRGEFVWHKVALAHPGMDAFYVFSSLIFLMVFVGGIWSYRRKRAKMEMTADIMSVIAFVASLGVMVAMSIRYDFGLWFYPSQEYPYFTSGRLITGTLIPFLAMYLMGMSAFLKWFRLERFRGIALAVIIVLITVSETILSQPVFGSLYNWFHN